jgi:small-conductance mechanosensitive channel
MDTTQWRAIIGDLLARLYQSLSEYFPSVLGAIALLTVGWLIARLLRYVATRLVARLTRRIPGRSLEKEVKGGGVDKAISDVVGAVVFWAVFLFFVAAATEALSLPVVTGGLERLAAYLPTVLAAVLVVLAGVVLGSLVGSLVSRAARSADIGYADALGQSAKIVTLLLAAVVALDQIGIDSTLLILVTAIIIGALLGGLALAFGLGARTAVANLLASHYLHQAYQVGQSVRIGEVRGRIVEMQAANVVIDAAEGRVLVPAKEFSETASVLLAEEG